MGSQHLWPEPHTLCLGKGQEWIITELTELTELTGGHGEVGEARFSRVLSSVLSVPSVVHRAVPVWATVPQKLIPIRHLLRVYCFLIGSLP